jgi:hypothetical protein
MPNFLWRSLSRARLSRKQREFLADTLRGHQPEQLCWANPDLRNHTLQTVAGLFGDDWNWCLQVTMAVYFIAPGSREEIDRIIAEHVESRSGSFPSELFEGKGWNPAQAVNFDAETAQYWRCYRAYEKNGWSSFELPRNPVALADLWKQSGYSYAGTRGCVRKLTLRQEVDEPVAAKFARAFMTSAERVLFNALGNSNLDALRQAVLQRTSYDGNSGPARMAFRMSGYQEPGEKPRQIFTLTVERV